MAREIAFSYGTIVPSTFLNDQQDLQSAQILGVTVTASGTSLHVNPTEDASGSGQTSVNINGQPYHINAQISLNMSGTANGTYDVYLQPDTGSAFKMVVVPHGAVKPAGTRGPVATFAWTSPNITGLVNTTDAVSGHAGKHQAGGSDPVGAATLTGLFGAMPNPSTWPGWTYIATDNPPPSMLYMSNGTQWLPLPSRLDASQALPGDLIASAAASRANCLLCDGNSWPTTGSTAALFAAITYTYGGSGGSFNVPDYRGRTIVGAGLAGFARGNTGGEQYHTLTSSEMPSHAHPTVIGDLGHQHTTQVGTIGGGSNVPGVGGGVNDRPLGAGALLATTGITVTVNNAGGGVQHNNMQPYAVANVFIHL